MCVDCWDTVSTWMGFEAAGVCSAPKQQQSGPFGLRRHICSYCLVTEVALVLPSLRWGLIVTCSVCGSRDLSNKHLGIRAANHGG